MTQTAQVKKILSDGRAQIAVTRQGACSHNCAECGGCSTAVMPTVTALAENQLGAVPGDLVIVETSSQKLIGLAALMYLLPMALLIFGYLLAQLLGLSDGYCILSGILFFALSMGGILLLDRYVKAHRSFQFQITKIKTV